MIETGTTWDDTGFDCDHCGGRILQRTDRETGRPDFSCYQCEACGCQWSLDNKPIRTGRKAACRRAQRAREEQSTPAEDNYSKWILVGFVVLAALFLLRFGGGVAVRILLPLIVVGVAAFFLIRYGRQQEWW